MITDKTPFLAVKKAKMGFSNYVTCISYKLILLYSSQKGKIVLIDSALLLQ
jgi:hypothetical protein